MARDIGTLLRGYGARIDELLDREFPRDGPPFLVEGARYQLLGGGKRIRPALCLLTCEALGGSADQAIPLALASEILHGFFLLHDDIQDGDRYRRDRETLWVRVGVANAINVGDFLIARAYRVLLSSGLSWPVKARLLEVFTDTLHRTVEGQALDINLRGDRSFTLSRYKELVTLKTGYHLGLNLAGAAVIARADEDAVEKFWDFGRWVGPAFQIQDDLLDLSAGKGRCGEIGCDIKEGKPAILFAYTMEHGDPESCERLVEILRKPREQTTVEDVQWAIELYRRNGAIRFAQEEAGRLTREAHGVIDTLPVRDQQLFRDLADYMIKRTS